MIRWNTFLLMEPNSPLMRELHFLHELICFSAFSILLIIFSEGFFLNYILYTDKTWSNSNKIEIFWTFLPLSVLIFLIGPSIRVLYLLEEPDTNPSPICCKITGCQWYWSYEIFENKSSTLLFDSYRIPYESKSCPFYLLEVDNRLILPFNVKVDLSLTSKDVIHSWRIPSIGFKLDAIPGRLNSGVIESLRPGVFWGQCSELCGVNHRYMPIIVEFIRMQDFKVCSRL